MLLGWSSAPLTYDFQTFEINLALCINPILLTRNGNFTVCRNQPFVCAVDLILLLAVHLTAVTDTRRTVVIIATGRL